MKVFGAFFFIAFFFSLFIFNQNKIGLKNYQVNRSISGKTSNSFDKINFRRSFISLNKDQPIKGLVYQENNLNDYMQRLFGQLLQQANELSNDVNMYLPSEGVFQNHNTFLLMSLAVPMHESSLSHFRRKNPIDYCYFSNSVIDPIHPKDFPEQFYPPKISKAYKVIESILKEEGIREPEEVLNKDTCTKKDSSGDVRPCGLKEAYKIEDELRLKYCKKYKFKTEFFALLNKKGEKDKYNKFEAYCSDLNFGLITLGNTDYLRSGIKRFDSAVGESNDFLHCEKLYEHDLVNQLLFSNDYQDIGIMMFNAKSHPEVFATGNIYDFDFVINYGLSFLFDGFYGLYNYALNESLKSNQFGILKGQECFHGYNGSTFSDRVKIMRGAWAGKYNSGNLGESCRMYDLTTPEKYKKNDNNYLKNLSKIFFEYKGKTRYENEFSQIKWNQGEKPELSLFHKYLPKDSIEYQAYKELINNVYYGLNDNTYIRKVLKSNYRAADSEAFEPGQEIIISDEIPPEEALSFVDEGYLALPETKPDTIEKLNHTLNETLEQRTDNFIENHVDFDIKPLEDIAKEDLEILNSSEKLEPEDEEIYLPHTPAVEYPVISESEITHFTYGTNINIRTAPNLNPDSICLNTKELGNSVYKLKKIDKINGFFKAKFEDLVQTELKARCGKENYFYIYYTVVRPKLNVKIGGHMYLTADRTVRDTYGASKSIEVGSIKASPQKPYLIRITNNHPLKYRGETYMWYEFIHLDGKKRWIYDTKIGGEPSVLRNIDEE